MSASLEVRVDEPLAPRTTLGLGGSADAFLEARTDSELLEGIAYAEAKELPLAVLGGGSNTIVPDDGVRGLVLQVATRGIAREGTRSVRVKAGEPWDEFVQWSVSAGLAGVECLSGIPGLVGASPIQNIGAYGQEVAETITQVVAFERKSGARRVFSNEECGFAYRDSFFKRRLGEFLVSEVVFALTPAETGTVRYPSLAKEVEDGSPLAEIRKAVLRVRRARSMVYDAADPLRRSAGSFFTNPIVSASLAEEVREKALSQGWVATSKEVPSWEMPDGRVKIAAAWLIERAGFRKDERRGAIGISPKHALALIHHGGASSRELLSFAEEIVEGVRAHTGVTLEREPRILRGER